MRQNFSKSTIDFSGYIADHTCDFTGREWVFKMINGWLANSHGSRFFLISGEPGSGKTALASRLCQFTQNIVPHEGDTFLAPGFLSAFYFCSARDLHWINPQTFIQSLIRQLADRYPAYARALLEKSSDRQVHLEVKQQIQQVTEGQVIGLSINEINTSNMSAEDLFSQYVREPLEALFLEEPNQQIVILVDALDEALLYSGSLTIVSLLAQVDHLPSSVRFLLTSRQDARVENEFLDAEGLSLSASQYDQHNQEDIRRYVEYCFSSKEALIPRLAQVDAFHRTKWIKQIRDKAVGNFQYVRFLLEDMTKSQKSLIALEGLPAGLDKLYFDSLARIVKYGKRDWYKDYAPLMGVLSVAQEGLTTAQLQAFTQQSESAIWTHLGDLQQFIEGVKGKDRERRYHLYHQSIIDFLRFQSLMDEKKDLRNTFYLAAEESHAHIISYYRIGNTAWANIDWKQVDNYGLRYLVAHLYALTSSKIYRQDLYGLICKPFMKEKQVRYDSYKLFVEDLVLMINVAEHEEPANLLQQIRGSLLYASIGSLTINVLPEALAVLARAGQMAKALDLAALVQDSRKQSQAYWMIGKILLSQNQLDETHLVLTQAQTAAEAIEDEADRTTAFSRLVPTLIEAGQIHQALEVAHAIEINQVKAIALSKVATTIARTGNNELAVTLAKQALDLVANDEQIKIEVLNTLIQALIQAGQRSQALVIAESIEDKKARTIAMMKIVRVLAEAGEKAQAVNIAKRMIRELEIALELGVAQSSEKEQTRIFIGTKIIQAFDQAELLDHALIVIEKILSAENMAHRLHPVREIFENLSTMEESIWITNVVYQSLIATQTIQDELNKTRVVSIIIHTLVEAKLFMQALQAMRTIWNESDRVMVLSSVVEALDKVEGEEWKMTIAKRTSLLKEIAQILAQDGQFDQALSVIELMLNEPDKAISLTEMTKISAQAGERERTITIVNHALIALESAGYEQNGASLKTIIQSLAEVGQFNKMLMVAETIKNRWGKATVLKEVAIALAERRQFDKALSVAKLIWNEQDQAIAFREITQTLVQVGERSQAATIAHQTLAIASEIWVERYRTSVLQDLAKTFAQMTFIDLALSAAKAIGDELTRVLALQEIAQILAQADEKGQARTIAHQALEETQAIKDRRDQAIAKGKTAQILARVEEKEQAIIIVSQVLIETESMTNEEDKAAVLKEIVPVLIQTGQLDQALMVAREIWSENVQVDALQKMIQAFIQHEQFDQALTAAGMIWNESARVRTHQKLVSTLIQMQQFDRALVAAEVIEDEKARIISYKEVVHAFIQTQQFDRALVAIKAIEDAEIRVLMTRELVHALIQAQQFQHALTVIKTIEDTEARAEAYKELVHAFIQMQQFDQALIAAKEINHRTARASALDEIVQAILETKEKGYAITIAHQAIDLADVLMNGWAKTSALKSIALALAQTGQFSRSTTVVAELKNEWDKMTTLGEIARIMACAGHFDQAIQMAITIENWEIQATTLVSIIGLMAQTGQFKRALTAIDLIRGEESKTIALREVAQALVQLKEKDDLVILVHQIMVRAKIVGHEEYSSEMLRNLALALAQVGLVDQALAILDQVEDHYFKTIALKQIAQILLKLGDLQSAIGITSQALAVAQTISNTLDKAVAFQEVAQALTKVQQFDQAVIVAEMIRDRRCKAVALQEIVQALIQVQQFDRALIVAETIRDRRCKVAALQEVAQALFKIRSKEHAVAIMNLALAVTESIEDRGNKVAALCEIAQILFQFGEKVSASNVSGQAVAIAETIKNQEDKTVAFNTLAQAMIQAQLCDQALLIARSMRDEKNKIEMLSSIAQALTDTGQFNEAKTIAVGIEHKWQKVALLKIMAQILTQKGHYEQVLQLLQIALATARIIGRESVYEVLEFSTTALSMIDEGQTLWNIYESLLEVDSWWETKEAF